MQTSIGPVPNDDYFVVNVVPSGGGTLFEQAVSGDLHGSVVAFVTLGLSRNGGILLPLIAYVAPGATVDLDLFQHHANGAISDTGYSAGWTWDPLGGLYIVAQASYGAAIADLALILQSVRKHY